MRKGFRASGIDHLSKGGSCHDAKPNARIFRNQRYTGESGFDPVKLWVMGPPCGLKVERGMTSCMVMIVRHVGDSLSVMLATTSVPRARNQENRFPARKARRTNRQSSRPSVVTEMSSITITESY